MKYLITRGDVSGYRVFDLLTAENYTLVHNSWIFFGSEQLLNNGRRSGIVLLLLPSYWTLSTPVQIFRHIYVKQHRAFV